MNRFIRLLCLLILTLAPLLATGAQRATASMSTKVATATAGGRPTTAPTTVPTTGPTIAVAGADGQVRHPLDFRGDQHAAVLLFIDTECPISNSYAQEFRRLCGDYRSKEIEIYFVYSGEQVTAASATEHARKFLLDGPLLLDPDHALARLVEATVTPEAVVVGHASNILYRGRIDDLYYGLSKRRFEATQHDLRDALDAIVAGHAVANPRTTATGCSIGG